MEEDTRLTYFSKGRDVRSMKHRINGVKKQDKKGGMGEGEERERLFVGALSPVNHRRRRRRERSGRKPNCKIQRKISQMNNTP